VSLTVPLSVSVSIEELEEVITLDDDTTQAQVPSVSQLVSCLQLYPLEDPFTSYSTNAAR